MNAVRLLNLTVLEPFVNDMTILTASMGTFEQYRSRKRRMLYHMFNGDGRILTMSQLNVFCSTTLKQIPVGFKGK